MKTHGERVLGVVWLGVAGLGLLTSPVSAQEPTLRATLKGGVYSVAYSPDGKTLASMGGQQISMGGEEIKLWDVATGKQADK